MQASDRAIRLRGGAEIEGFISRREHHRYVALLPDPLRQIDAVHAGHPQVGQYQVRERARQLGHRLEAVRRHLDQVARLSQYLTDELACVPIVVDDQDSLPPLTHLPASHIDIHHDGELSKNDTTPDAPVGDHAARYKGP